MTNSRKFDSFSLQFSHQLSSKHTFRAASHEKFIISLLFEGDWFCNQSDSVSGCSGSCHRSTRQDGSRPQVTQCPVHALTPFPNVTGPCIRPELVLYLKINKAIWKTQSKMEVEVPVVSIYTWDVAIFCCTFGLLQRRKGSLGVS